MKRFLTGLVFYSVFATQAAALSCMPQNIARTFNWVNDAPDIYVMGLGVLTPKAPIPKYEQGKPRHIASQFSGVFFGPNGQTETQTIAVTVDAICFASWCGGYPKTDENMLAFFKRTDAGYRLESNPCDGHFKVAPTKKEIKLLQKCFSNQGCSKRQVKSLNQWQ